MKLALKLTVSLLMGAVCIWYVLAHMDRVQVWDNLIHVPVRAVLLYFATLALVHFFRTWRWDYLLRPLGVTVPFRELLPISSAGFMAIFALPFRLGEFIRPYFLTQFRPIRMSAALGTVAVERILDGLMVSIVFFAGYLLSAKSTFSPELRFAAWLSLLGFMSLTTFLALALKWPQRTIRLTVRITFLHRLAPRIAERLQDKLGSLISGFRGLVDVKNISIFVVQSALYWGWNGVGMWILARAMGVHISVGAAFATMAFTGVVLCLPNSPGLVGQFHFAVTFVLLAYLPETIVKSNGIAYAIVLHGIQGVWYLALGLVSLGWLSRRQKGASLAAVVRESQRAAEQAGTEAA